MLARLATSLRVRSGAFARHGAAYSAGPALSSASSSAAAASSSSSSGAAGARQSEPPVPPPYTTLAVTYPARHVARVTLTRPAKLNALNRAMWGEIGAAMRWLAEPAHPSRVIIIDGAGAHFTSGLDLQDHAELLLGGGGGDGGGGGGARPRDVGRRALALHGLVRSYQASLSALDECNKPVIAAVAGACIGAGVDLICAADIRLATACAFFQIKEVELGLAADVGTLQRLPRIVGSGSLVRELAYTARRLLANEALSHGLVSAVLADEAALHARALELATSIAQHSPLAVQGTKANLNFARDTPSVEAGLRYAAAWNAAMLQSGDLAIAAAAAAPYPVGSRRPTRAFPDLAD